MLEDLVTDILADLTGDDGDSLVAEAYVRRQAERALALLADDLEVAYALDGDDVDPEMPAEHRELWALKTKVLVCRHLRAQAASRVSFASGDKRMDRSKEASNWASLEEAFASEYADRLRRENPAVDPSVLTPNVRPVVYEAGAEVDP